MSVKEALISRIIAFEDGMMDTDDVVPFFQDLIDTGLAWKLQGAYGRAAKSLIDQGQCTPPQSDTSDE